MVLSDSPLTGSVGHSLSCNLFQQVLFLLFQSCKVSQFRYAGGLGAASLERFVSLTSGLNCLPCWALISVSERKGNNLYNSSRGLEAELWDCTQLGPSHGANLRLSSTAQKGWWRDHNHSQQIEKTVLGPVLSTWSWLCSVFIRLHPGSIASPYGGALIALP